MKYIAFLLISIAGFVGGLAAAFLIINKYSPGSVQAWGHWVQATAVLVAIVLGVLSIFQEQIRALWFKPELDVSFEMGQQCVKHIFFKSLPNGIFEIEDIPKVTDEYHFKIKITNNGNRPAENIEVSAVKLEDAEGKEVEGFIPHRLRWEGKPDESWDRINPKASGFCDIGKINYMDPEYFFFLGTGFRYFCDPLFLREDLILNVNVYASNAKPRKAKLKIGYTGKWPQEPQKISEEINVEVI